MDGQTIVVGVPPGVVGGEMMVVDANAYAPGAGAMPPPMMQQQQQQQHQQPPPMMMPHQHQQPPPVMMQQQHHQPPPMMMPQPGAVQGTAASAPDLYTTFDATGKYTIVEPGAFGACQGVVRPNDGVKSEAGAMLSMSPNIKLSTTMEGGLGAACCRCCCTGESFFFSKYTVEGGEGDVLLGPSIPGDVMVVHMDGSTTYKIQKGSYLACDESIAIRASVQGCCQGLMSGEGFIIQEAEGVGRLILNSYGSIVRYDLAPGEVRVVDSGCMVAWSGHMQYSVGLASQQGGLFQRLKNSFLTGEAIVCRFTGPGTVYVQTRSLFSTALRMWPYLPENKRPKPSSE